MFLGQAWLYAASRKQKCVTKSPTDSELVALSDNFFFCGVIRRVSLVYCQQAYSAANYL